MGSLSKIIEGVGVQSNHMSPYTRGRGRQKSQFQNNEARERFRQLWLALKVGKGPQAKGQKQSLEAGKGTVPDSPRSLQKEAALLVPRDLAQ